MPITPEISLSELGNSVVFQYGTAFTETNFVGTPVVEPSSLALFGLLGAGVLGMAGLIRRRLT
jgi:MYXO-CTERM domain-containing protein